MLPQKVTETPPKRPRARDRGHRQSQTGGPGDAPESWARQAASPEQNGREREACNRGEQLHRQRVERDASDFGELPLQAVARGGKAGAGHGLDTPGQEERPGEAPFERTAASLECQGRGGARHHGHGPEVVDGLDERVDQLSHGSSYFAFTTLTVIDFCGPVGTCPLSTCLMVITCWPGVILGNM